MSVRICLLALLVFAAGCERLALQPQEAASAPSAAAIPDLRAHVGETYSSFVGVSIGAQYGPDALGLTAADRARLWRAMANGAPGVLIEGGGAAALVFRGCAAEGCDNGRAVVAVDVTTGDAFAGVRDIGGAEELAPNDRIEALLRLMSPTRGWDDAPAPPEGAAL